VPLQSAPENLDEPTRVGTIDLALPKLRQGTYFPRLAAGAAAPGIRPRDGWSFPARASRPPVRAPRR
jgi:hypothetical protein